MIQYIKSTYGDAVDVIGGNAVTVSQIRHLIEAGVDGIRVGMGAATISTVSVCPGCLGGECLVFGPKDTTWQFVG